MGDYYYVFMDFDQEYYDNQGCCNKTETAKEVYKFVSNKSLGYLEPAALAINKVRCRKVERNYMYVNEYESFFMICEDKGTSFEDVITGKNYKKSGQQSNNEVPKEFALGPLRQIPVGMVAELLKSLNLEEIQRYKINSDNLDKAIIRGKKLDQIRIHNEKIEKENNESFIKNFKNKYGK